MNQKFTFTLIAVCIIYLSQSNALLAVSTESYLLNGPLENSVLPVDTPKKNRHPHRLQHLRHSLPFRYLQKQTFPFRIHAGKVCVQFIGWSKNQHI